MDSIWQYGGCMMNFINGINTLIRRVNWITLFVWLVMGGADPKPPKPWKMFSINNSIFWQYQNE